MELQYQTKPLIEKSGTALYDYVYSIEQRVKPVETSKQKVSKFALNAIAGIFSGTAKVFYVPISLQIGSEIGNSAGMAFGTFCAFCNIKAFFLLEMWAARGIIHDLIRPKTPEEMALFREEIKQFVQIVIVVAAIATSGFSQIPYAYPAADYAKSSKFLIGTVSLIASILIPTRSIQLTFKYLYKKRQDRSKDQTILRNQRSLVALTRQQQAVFAAKPKLPLQNKTLNETKDPVHSYLENRLTINDQQKNSNENRYLSPGNIVGVICTGIFEYALGDYTFSKSKSLLWNNNIFGGLIAGTVVASTTYLYGKAILASTNRIYFMGKQCVQKNRVKSLGEQLYSKLNIGLKIEESITNFFALGASWIIWSQYYQNSWKEYFFPISMGATLYLILLTSSFDTIDDITLSIAKQKGNKLALINEEYNDLARGFENAPEEDFDHFYKNLPNSLKIET